MNRILFDNIIFSLQTNGGISVYWYELCKRLINDERFYKNFINPHNLNKLGNSLEFSKSLSTNNKINLFNNILMPNVFMDKHIFHSSYYRFNKNSNAINVTTIHDFIHLKKYKGYRKYTHKIFKNYCINNSDYFITISENTKNDFLEYYPYINNNKITVIYNGVSEDFFKLSSNYNQNLLSENEHQKYFLFVGSRHSYKNFIPLVKTLKSFSDYNLYIVGDILSKNEIYFLNKYLKNKWKLFTNISNIELNILYNYAFSLIYPSTYEGFGIPIIEAMKSGTPVIALNNSSIPEVSGNAGIILNNLDTIEFSEAISKINSYRAIIIENGLKQSALFSWDLCYKKTTDLYLKLLS